MTSGTSQTTRSLESTIHPRDGIMSDTAQGIRDYMRSLSSTLQQLDNDQVARIVDTILEAQRQGKTVMTMGNGGHGSTAAHIINDLAKHTISNDSKTAIVSDKRFKTLCLNDSVSFLTAVANDMGYEHVFSEQVRNWCEPGDVVIGISGSGNSQNVLNAFAVARERGAATICLSGKGGGKAKDIADICLIVPSEKMVHIEDAHLAVCHAIADELKKAIQARTEISG